MKSRLSLDDRNEIAFKLRLHVLSIERPELMESLSDEKFQPHRMAVGIYAFEFFLDRYRKWFHETQSGPVAYGVGWSRGAINRDEEKRYPNERLFCMSATLFMVSSTENGFVDKLTNDWYKKLSRQKAPISKEHLSLFLFEIAYELALELSRELAAKLK